MPLLWRNEKSSVPLAWQMVFEEIGAAVRRQGSKALCRRTGEGAGLAASADQGKLTWTPMMCGVEKPGSSNWRVAEQLFSPRLRRGLDTLVQTSLVLLLGSRPHGCPGCMCCPAGPSVPAARALLRRQGSRRAAGSQETRRGCSSRGAEDAPAERWLQPARSVARSFPNFPRLPRPSPPGSRRGPAGREQGCSPVPCPGRGDPASLRRAGTGTRGKPGADAASVPPSAPAEPWARGELREKGPSRAPCLSPAPAPASSPGHWDWWINHDVAAVNAFMWSGLCQRLAARRVRQRGERRPLRSAPLGRGALHGSGGGNGSRDALPVPGSQGRGRAEGARQGSSNLPAGGQEGSGCRGRCAGCVRFASPRFPQILPVV